MLYPITQNIRKYIYPREKVLCVPEIVIHVGGRKVSVEVSDEEAKNILNDLVFGSIAPLYSEECADDASPNESDDHIVGPLNESISASDFMPIPSKEEIKNFIKSQPNYRHSVESLAEYFAKKKVSVEDGKAAGMWLNAIRTQASRIRGEIGGQEEGQWRSETRGRQKQFTFVNSSSGMPITFNSQRSLAINTDVMETSKILDR